MVPRGNPRISPRVMTSETRISNLKDIIYLDLTKKLPLVKAVFLLNRKFNW